MLAATPAFRDSTCGVCGMAITSSIFAIRSRGKPGAFVAEEDCRRARQICLIERRAFVRGGCDQAHALCSQLLGNFFQLCGS